MAKRSKKPGPRRGQPRKPGRSPELKAVAAAADALRKQAPDQEEPLRELLEAAATAARKALDKNRDPEAVGDLLFGAVAELVTKQQSWAPLRAALDVLRVPPVALTPRASEKLFVRGRKPPSGRRYASAVARAEKILRTNARKADDPLPLEQQADLLSHAAFLAERIASLDPPHLDARAIAGPHRTRARRLLREFALAHTSDECERGVARGMDESKLARSLSTTGEQTEELSNTPALLLELGRELEASGNRPAAAVALRHAVRLLASGPAPARMADDPAVGFLAKLLEIAATLKHPWVGAEVEQAFGQLEMEPAPDLEPQLAALRVQRGEPARAEPLVRTPRSSKNEILADELFVPDDATSLADLSIAVAVGRGGYRCYVRATLDGADIVIEGVDRDCPPGWGTRIESSREKRDGRAGTLFYCSCAAPDS